MIPLLYLIGGLAVLCLVLVTTSAYTMGEIKGQGRGYEDGLMAGYWHGYADAMAHAKNYPVETAQDTGECEAIL